MRRGLVIMGGGAKGAYSCGAMRALQEHGYRFEAVSGTSAGALNAAIWAAGDLKKGSELWISMSPETSYQRDRSIRWLPRLLARGIGSLAVVIALLAARLTGSPIDGKSEKHVQRAIMLITFLILWALLTFASALPLLAAAMALILTLFFQLAFSYNDMSFSRDRRHNALLIPAGLSAWVAMGLLVVRYDMATASSAVSDRLGTAWLIPLIAMASIAIALTVSWASRLLGQIRVLDSEPLRKTLQDFLHPRPFKVPIYVTMASSVYIFDPDDPTWVSDTDVPSMAAQIYGPWDPHSRLRWLPRYTRIDQLPVHEAIECIMASSALPFGIVGPVEIKGLACVDGGVVDNLPIVPLLAHDLDEIVVLHLAPMPKGVTEEESHALRCADLLRLLALEDRPLPSKAWGERPDNCRLEPPVIVPRPNLSPFPSLMILRPEQHLGGLFNGLLNFSPAYATKMIERGYADTKASLKALRSESAC